MEVVMQMRIAKKPSTARKLGYTVAEAQVEPPVTVTVPFAPAELLTLVDLQELNHPHASAYLISVKVIPNINTSSPIGIYIYFILNYSLRYYSK